MFSNIYKSDLNKDNITVFYKKLIFFKTKATGNFF